MIVLFLLSSFIIQIQASQYQLTAAHSSLYMSMSKQELYQKAKTIEQELIDQSMTWHKEKVCGIRHDIIGAGSLCCILSTTTALGIYCNIPPSIMAPCGSAVAYAFDQWYKPDQRPKKDQLKEIHACIKFKTD